MLVPSPCQAYTTAAMQSGTQNSSAQTHFGTSGSIQPLSKIIPFHVRCLDLGPTAFGMFCFESTHTCTDSFGSSPSWNVSESITLILHRPGPPAVGILRDPNEGTGSPKARSTPRKNLLGRPSEKSRESSCMAFEAQASCPSCCTVLR